MSDGDGGPWGGWELCWAWVFWLPSRRDWTVDVLFELVFWEELWIGYYSKNSVEI